MPFAHVSNSVKLFYIRQEDFNAWCLFLYLVQRLVFLVQCSMILG